MQNSVKIKWTKYCVLPAAGADNVKTNFNNIIFPIKDTKLYLTVVTLSARDNQKLSAHLSKGFERSIYWNQFKTKNKNKKTTNFVGVNRSFNFVYSNQDDNAKRFKTRRCYLPNGIIKNYNITNGRNFYDKKIDSDIKLFEEIRKLATIQGENYTTGCLQS